ncbi:hypothetical protein [Methylobacterium sp. NEAU K]|uniref:hypothetical protein n=1 Tax=Methylobacterium sp. NEAU K TaxID=3064946 RepID=UPI00273502F7|nr:hypothetical protein [Methylobacterium sp. NEAU K]MDP4004439.1 hypothetical protein [Methylobacterium sp. NEAU K]
MPSLYFTNIDSRVVNSCLSSLARRGWAIRLSLVAALAALPVRVSNGLAAESPAPAEAGSAPRPDSGPAALIASLKGRVLAAHSATLALESWCAEYGLAGDPHLVALRLPVADKPLTAAQRTRLAIGPDEPVRYRRVRLACGDRVLSEADNWYVPARLTPEMNTTLDGTRTPFGRVVRPLDPVRRTVAVRPFAQHPEPGPDDPLFEVDAVLVSGAGQPFCEVVETYLGGALPEASR